MVCSYRTAYFRNRLVHCLYGYKTINGSVGMSKSIELSDEELELLITGLHCVDERTYNFYTTTYVPWSKAKEIKENLRVKLKRTLLNV